MSTDRLVFRRPDGMELICGWDGPWPPPGRFTLIVGARAGEAALYDPDDPRLDQAAVDWLVAAGAATEVFRRESASEATEAAPADAHWFRGALYVPAAMP